MKKKIKLLVATNLYQIDPVVYSSHLDMFYKLGKRHEDFEIVFNAPWRIPIDSARNNAVTLAVATNCDYIFFYDDDMWFPDGKTPIDLIQRMIDNPDISMIQALAFIRGYPYKPMLFKFIDTGDNIKKLLIYENYEKDVDENGLVEVDAVGCCATVIDVNVFKAIPKPWFMTGEGHTEDIYFCVKAKSLLKRFGIYCDTTLPIGHLLDRAVLMEGNRPMLREMHEKYSVNQLFLTEPFYAEKMSLTPHMQWDEKRLLNPLTVDREG